MYKTAYKLIMAGAGRRGVECDHFKRVPTASKLLKLLYNLGVYVDIAEDDLIYNWIKRQPVKPLLELAEMAVRLNCSPR